MLDDEMLTIDDLAAYLKLRPQTIYKWAQAGKIPGAKFGKEWRFRRSQIEAWIDNRMAQFGVPPLEKPPQQRREAGSNSSADDDASSAAEADPRDLDKKLPPGGVGPGVDYN